MNTHTESDTAICTIVAPSSRQALRLLREKLGPDAIVLSNKVIAEGVEIVATLDEAAADTWTAAIQSPVPTPLPVASEIVPSPPVLVQAVDEGTAFCVKFIPCAG